MHQLKPIVRSVALACNGAVLAIAFAAPAHGQQAPGQQQLERVEITGSAIRRVDAETALPVQIISRQDIERSGVSNVEQLIQTITAISAQGGTVMSFGAGTSNYGQSTVSLRGLGDTRTLLLVNGRRLNTGNVNNIPLAAIDRVEVLKDGASAIYGSDAVAGVVNFVLIRNFQGVEVAATAGTPSRSGGGQNYKASLVAGFGDLNKDRYTLTASFSVEEERKLLSKERDFAKTGNVEPYLFSGATGQGNIEGAIDPTKVESDGLRGLRLPGFGNSPGRGYGNPLAAAGRCGDINMYREVFDTNRGYPYCSFDSAANLALLPDRDAYGLTLNGAFKLTNSVELFGDVLYSESKVVFPIQPSPLRRSFMVTNDLFRVNNEVPALLLRPNNPNYSIAANYLNSIGQGALVGQTLAFTARPFDFGLRTSDDKTTETRIVGGLRGNVMSQDFEVAYAFNDSKIKGSVTDGYFSMSGFARVVNAPNSDYNPWSLTQSAATTAALLGTKYSGPTLDRSYKSSTLDGKISGSLVALPAGDSQYAAGLSMRKFNYSRTPSAALESGDISGLGGAQAALDRDRTVKSAFAEAVAPIIKGLEAGAAVRFDDYDDVGSKTTYKANLRWQPTSSLLVRAGYGTGFRAPTLPDLWDPQLLGTSELFRDPLTGQSNLQVNELSGGNPNLKPEKSTQRSLGIVFQPMRSLSMGLDFFWIKVEDIITTPSTQEVVSGFRAGNPTYADKVKLSSSGDIEQTTAILVNSGTANLSGVDVQANYAETFGFGRFKLDLFGTYMTKFDQTSPGGAVSHKVGTIVDQDGNPVLGADSGGVILRWKHVLTGTLTRGPWSVSLTQNFYKGYETAWRQWDDERNFVSDQAIYDTRIAYEGIKNARISLGVKNLFDKKPPIFIPVANQFQAGYDVSLYDARARFIYLSGSYKFN